MRIGSISFAAEASNQGLKSEKDGEHVFDQNRWEK